MITPKIPKGWGLIPIGIALLPQDKYWDIEEEKWMFVHPTWLYAADSDIQPFIRRLALMTEEIASEISLDESLAEQSEQSTRNEDWGSW